MIDLPLTDEGPFAPDVFWGLHDSSGQPKVVYPGGATGDNELLVELQGRLPGFDNRKLIEAMGSSSNAHFLIWKKEGFVASAE